MFSETLQRTKSEQNRRFFKNLIYQRFNANIKIKPLLIAISSGKILGIVGVKTFLQRNKMEIHVWSLKSTVFTVDFEHKWFDS